MAKTRKQPMRMRKSKSVKTRKNLIGPLKKDELKNLGYSTSKSAVSRHRALNKSVKKYGALKTFRKLNAVATLNKNRAPSVSKVFLRDREWVNKKYIKSKTKRRIKKGGAEPDNRPKCSVLETKYRIPIENVNMNDCQKAYDNNGNIIENKYATQPEEIQCNQMVLYSLNPVMTAMKELLENPDKLMGELLLKAKEFFRDANDEEFNEMVQKANIIEKLPEDIDISALREILKREGTMEKIVDEIQKNNKFKENLIGNVTKKLALKQTKICNDSDTNQKGGVIIGTYYFTKPKLAAFIILSVITVLAGGAIIGAVIVSPFTGFVANNIREQAKTRYKDSQD